MSDCPKRVLNENTQTAYYEGMLASKILSKYKKHVSVKVNDIDFYEWYDDEEELPSDTHSVKLEISFSIKDKKTGKFFRDNDNTSMTIVAEFLLDENFKHTDKVNIDQIYILKSNEFEDDYTGDDNLDINSFDGGLDEIFANYLVEYL